MAAEGTEPPTARRLRDARQRGLVPRSSLLAPAAVLAMAVATWELSGEGGFLSLQRWLERSLASAGQLSAIPATALDQVWAAAAWLALPLCGVLAVAWLSDLLQVGVVWATSSMREPVRPLLSGWLSGTLLALVLVVALSWAVPAGWTVQWVELGVPSASPEPAWTRFAQAFGLGLALVVAVDVARARARHASELRMTRREQARERRESEGPVEPKRRRQSLWALLRRGTR